MTRTSIDDRLEYMAQNGAYELPLHLWGNTAKRLERNGLVLIPTGKDNGVKGQHHYQVTWRNASMSIPSGPFDVDHMVKELHERHAPISHANMLWLMAESFNRK